MFPFLQTLKKHGFKKMILQIGNGAVVPDCDNSTCIEMEYFRFKPSISDDIAKASVVISHAGMTFQSSLAGVLFICSFMLRQNTICETGPTNACLG